MAFAGQKFDSGLMDAVSGVGDPWVTALNTADLNRTLENLPRGPGGAVDYNAAAMKLLGRHPLASQQMLKIAQMRQSAGQHGADLSLRKRALDIQEAAANKPQYRQDDEGDWVAMRPDGTSVYVTGVLSGQPGGTPRPKPAAPPPPAGLSADVLPEIDTLGAEPTSRVPSSADVTELNRDPSPENVAKFDAYFGKGTSQKVLGTGKRSEMAPPPMAGLSDGAPTQEPMPEPSTTMPGTSIQRVAGQGLQLPEGVGTAMGQAVDADSMPEIDPNERPEQRLGAKGRRAVEQASQIDANKKQNTLMEKQVESALMVKDYIPSINRAVGMWNKLKENKSALQSDLPLVNSGVGTAVLRGARGVANAFGVGGSMPDIVANQQYAQPYREAMAHLELLRAQAMKGQGQITESERAILRRSLPSLDTSNPEETEKQLRELADVLTTIYKRGALASRALKQRESGPR